MLKVIKEIEVDVVNQNPNTTITAKQGDMNSRFLKITLTNNGNPLLIDPSVMITINVKRMDGSSKIFQGTLDTDGKVEVELNSWMLELSGIVKCDVSIINDNKKLTSFDFYIDVAASACAAIEISNSVDYDILSRLIAKTESLLSRTYWSEYTKIILVDNEPNFATNEFFEYKLKEDELCRILINGVEYKDTVKHMKFEGLDVYFVGNFSSFGEEDNGLPFAFYYVKELGGSLFEYTGDDDNITVTIEVNQETVHKIPSKYIPDTSIYSFNIMDDGDGNYTTNETPASIREAIDSGRQIQAMLSENSFLFVLYLTAYTFDYSGVILSSPLGINSYSIYLTKNDDGGYNVDKG